MKKNKWILIIMLMLLPITVFASTSPDIELPLGVAIFMEAFITVHMSAFVLWPLSQIYGKDNEKKLFWTLFIIRVVILLFCDFFITTSIAMIDFFSVFIGAFIVVPICAAITKTQINKKSNQVIRATVIPNTTVKSISMVNCTKCGSSLNAANKYCPNCGTQLNGNENVVTEVQPAQPQKIIINPSNFDSIYSLSEDAMVEEFINRELTKARFDKTSNLIPRDILKRKKVLNTIFAILVLIFISLIFFHFPIYTYIIGLIILFISYKFTRKYDLIKYLKKELKSRPSEKASNIIMTVKSNLVPDNSKSLFIGSICLAIILPTYIFMNPRILYEKVDNGYGVRFYTFGLKNFTSAIIPETHNDEKVVSLRGNTFSNMFFLKAVTLPDTITEIRGQAFKNDIKLTEINLPSSLEYLGGGAFYNCTSLTKIEIPDTVNYIGGESFYNAKSLKSIKLPNNITEIRGNTFENCSSLESITIPDSVTRIGGHAFYGCSSLNEVKLTSNSQLNEIGSSAFRLCTTLYNISLPRDVYINERAFKESPTSVNYFQSVPEKHTVTIPNTGQVSYITTAKYGTIALTISNVDVVGDYLHLTLNMSGGINQTLELICDGSTTHIYEDFYITTNYYGYKASTTTLNFYY